LKGRAKFSRRYAAKASRDFDFALLRQAVVFRFG
jgi:hypothetical protein